MAQPPPAFKIGSIIWAIVIGIGLIALAGSVLLPSTKRARIQFHPDPEFPPATATNPATQP